MFLNLFTGTSSSDVSFLVRLSGSSVVKGGVRRAFEGAWFRTVNRVEGLEDPGNTDGMDKVRGREGWREMQHPAAALSNNLCSSLRSTPHGSGPTRLPTL